MHFNVGDRVRVRQWDDMEHCYELDYAGDIRFVDKSPFFIAAMKYLCGKAGTITGVTKDKWNCGVDEVTIEFDDVFGDNWWYSNLMFEPEEDLHNISDAAKNLFDFLNGE